MSQAYQAMGGAAITVRRGRGVRRTVRLLAPASLIILLCEVAGATANDCAGSAAPPADIATPATLYDTLRTRTNAQLLAIDFRRRPVEQACVWIYEVKMLTASGSVVELDFDAAGLDLVGARGPHNDRDAAALVSRFGGDAGVLTTGANTSDAASGAVSNGGTHGGSSGGNDHGASEGGNSGSGSGGSGASGGGSGGGGGGDAGGGDDGGEGGDSGGGEGGEGGDD